MNRIFLVYILWFFPSLCCAHIGSPTVVTEGLAGPYPIRVVIRPPIVIPGRAEIDIRFLRPVSDETKVLILPVTAVAGLKGAPAPDETTPVSGDPSLRHGELWFMTTGSYSVHITVSGSAGSGKFIVPVDAIAVTTLPMSSPLKAILSSLGLLLFVGAIALVVAGAKESTLAPEVTAGRREHVRSLWVGAIATIIFGFLVIGGKRWWEGTDRWYRSNQIYRALPLAARVSSEDGLNTLHLNLESKDSSDDTPLTVLPDHGKLMHLFAIREPSLDAFAHLHPIQISPGKFDVVLPALPEGRYTLYADVTYENGFAATLTTPVDWPAPLAKAAPSTRLKIDPDDAWIGSSANDLTESAALENVGARDLHVGEAVSLDFRAVDRTGQPVESEPYMGMLGHAAVRKNDGTVFAHLHPLGTISMASQAYFQNQANRQAAPSSVRVQAELCEAGVNVSFPYEFPTPGKYRVWVQTKVKDRVITGIFDFNVLAKN